MSFFFEGDDVPQLFLALLSLFEIHVMETSVDLGCVQESWGHTGKQESGSQDGLG